MFSVTREISFCYGHRLLNYNGKCKHLHGHNGKAVITLEAPTLDQLGMVMDFTQLKRVVNWARRSSLWPLPFATACCGIEVMATASSRYDLARFGAEAMRFSPRQSDLLIVAGRVGIKMMPILQHIYQQMTEPKWVISMGACASTGGVFDAYATIQGIHQFMPVDVYVPGCPPRPETLIEGIMAIQRIIDEDGLPPAGKRRPLQVAVEPSYRPTPQPVPLTVGGTQI